MRIISIDGRHALGVRLMANRRETRMDARMWASGLCAKSDSG
jgi:hypothetical protein